MEKTTKIGIFNNKGGVAKTTSVINLAYSLQNYDKRVLVVDCDTQENCFSFFMSGKSSEMILATDYEKISHTTWDRYKRLDKEPEGFDYIIFDMPPTLSDEVKTILGQCSVVYVPTILGEFEIAGLKRVTDEINAQGVKLGGVFVTMYQEQNDGEIIKEFRKLLRNRMMATVIPYSKTVRESQKAGLPIEAYFAEKGVPKTKTSWKIVNAYEDLALEVMRG
ncbi:MAG: ParA family protein [Ruminococcus albus]|nr:ParA family protein [Ruminococcus albus]